MEYTRDKFSTRDVLMYIEDIARYKKEIILKIENIHCINCVKVIRSSISKKLSDYIDFLDIDFQSQRMFIKLKKDIQVQKILDEIRNLGYSAKVEEQIDPHIEHKKSVIELINLIIAISLATFVLIISMFFCKLLESNDFIRLLVLVFSTVVQFVNGFRFYRNAFYSVRNGSLNMDVLIVISTTSAYIYSLYGYFVGFNHFYFETSSVIIAVVLLGRYIEGKYKKKSYNSILNLLMYKPQWVTVYKDDNLINVDVEQIKEGDIIQIYKGQSVPVDGKVLEGEGIFDFNLLFGESEPIKISVGNEIKAGSILVDGSVKIQASCSYRNSFWKGIETSVYSLYNKNLAYQKFIDKISGNFVIIVVIFAVLSFIYWYFSGNKDFAVNAFISTLVIACPCAIGLAYPLAINKGMLEASRKQIIVKDPYVFEKICRSKNFIFDKTGTITNKNIKITDFRIFGDDRSLTDCFLDLTLASVSKSKHPLAEAIKEYILKNYNKNLYQILKKVKLESYNEITSRGIITLFENGYWMLIGNKFLLDENKIQINSDNTYENYIVLLKQKDVLIYACLDTIEEINDGVEEIIEILYRRNKELYILTGADKKSTGKILERLKIDRNKVFCSVDSVSKVKVVESIRNTGLTVFVGDGINDSLVMKNVDVGISFEYGSDITQNASSITLKSIDQFKDLIIISEGVFKKLKFNLFWVFAYNVLFIPIAMGVFKGFGITVNPMLAAIAMVLSDFSLLFFNLGNLKIAKN
ncbi:MAG: cation-translocating P-type ATPase [Candidatus Calescibacterium sp.]|nr:cation-translocating P-type ATPase [Candidatus Calescibacterium sp.]MCX7971781.1 cation-translocating P-type ATPase [bacterium]MDW8195387.1 cation-translocating P-type ATPase [Candidatus Calescibacterium sp.]